MSVSKRDWLLPYFSAWTTYGALYTVVFVLYGVPPALAILASFLNVAPGAAFGLGVLWALDRYGAAAGWRRLVVLHGGLGLGFAALSALVTFGSMVCWLYLREGTIASLRLREELVMRMWQVLFSLIIYAVLAMASHARRVAARLGEERERADRAEALRARAELQALRAQLNPHFLFNTLHALLGLVRLDATAAEEAIEQFGEMLRYALAVNRRDVDKVRLAEEWRFAELYLTLERLRLGDRLRVVERIDPDALRVEVPPFSIQTLVENAVRHAVAPRAAGGTVWIEATLRNGLLAVSVRDDGPGADPAAVRASGGLGLRLVEQRLEAVYGAGTRLRVDTGGGAGFTASFEIPARSAELSGEDRQCESALS
jgi:sensor histidine kinase YesM